MPRFRTIATRPGQPENRVQLTAAEEIARDAEEQVAADAKPLEDLNRLRAERDTLLVSSDWTQSPDSPLDDEAKASWITYRQQLRDLPATVSDPADPTWPTPPE